MTQTAPQYSSKSLIESLLGPEESQILHAIERGFTDINSIHLLTGIPLPCIQNKADALIGLGIVKINAGEFYCVKDAFLTI